MGGIPEHYDKTYMVQLMSYYGIIEEIEIFTKFAFIKYKQASEVGDCVLACGRDIPEVGESSRF